MISVQYHKSQLVLIFLCWKAWLLVIALFAPGHGYDTSTSILLQTLADPHEAKTFDVLSSSIIEKLSRWDAFYYLSIARRGYVFEQEWAFGWGYTSFLRTITNVTQRSDLLKIEAVLEAAVGVILSHLAHLLSVLVLFDLTATAYNPSQRTLSSERSRINLRRAFIAASLHIFSPAGLFLSAPYPESSFSFLHFLGFYLFAKSFSIRSYEWARDALLLLSGVSIGLATTLRSNGILSGLIFLPEIVRLGWRFAGKPLPLARSLPVLRRMAAVGVNGLLIGLGLFIPQYIAYNGYCTTSSPRPWCSSLPPSIYTWNQHVYWGVGFLRYWTLSNLPLFLLAAPMLFIMIKSSVWAMKGGGPTEQGLGWKVALPQLTLTVLAIFVYHVQIITRISSGYVVWYWWLAEKIAGSGKSSSRAEKTIFCFMVIYASVQGALFASFLPPA